ncbi:MAG: superoxide dismutase family protein [Gemmatimonadota bacterium]|nr:superoxide dismutase family protein [Gemmatimonadota bacterium]
MSRTMKGASFAIGLFILAACNKSFLTSHPVAVAGATLSDSAGHRVGTASLWQEADGIVHVDVEITCAAGGSCTALTPGDHGIHFHSVASCVAASSPAFSSAGGHYNPLSKQHGLANALGPHAGDAPNLTVGADGRGKASFTTDRVTITAGATSLFDADGSSIVIHSGVDDQMSQPSGGSGVRVACGVVKTVP